MHNWTLRVLANFLRKLVSTLTTSCISEHAVQQKNDFGFIQSTPWERASTDIAVLKTLVYGTG